MPSSAPASSSTFQPSPAYLGASIGSLAPPPEVRPSPHAVGYSRTDSPLSRLRLSSLRHDNSTTTFRVARLSSRRETTLISPDMITLPSAMETPTNPQLWELRRCRIITIIRRSRSSAEQNRITLPTVGTRRQAFSNTTRLAAIPTAPPPSPPLSPCTTRTLPRSPVGPRTAKRRFSPRSRLVAQTTLTRRIYSLGLSRRTTRTTVRTCI